MRRIGEAVDSARFTPPPSPIKIAVRPRRAGLAAGVEDRSPAPASVDGYLFSFDCPMISWAVKLMLQLGNELPTKKLSAWVAWWFSPSLKLGSSPVANGNFTDWGTTCP